MQCLFLVIVGLTDYDRDFHSKLFISLHSQPYINNA